MMSHLDMCLITPAFLSQIEQGLMLFSFSLRLISLNKELFQLISTDNPDMYRVILNSPELQYIGTICGTDC